MNPLQRTLSLIGLDDAGLAQQKRVKRLCAAKARVLVEQELCSHMDDDQLRDWIRSLPHHPRVSRADEMDRAGVLYVTHWVRTINPCEAGMFAFLDPEDMKLYAIAYVAR